MKGKSDPELAPHRGPMSGAPITGVGGGIVAIGIVALALIGLPTYRWFILGSVATGILIALFLFWKRRSN